MCGSLEKRGDGDRQTERERETKRQTDKDRPGFKGPFGLLRSRRTNKHDLYELCIIRRVDFGFSRWRCIVVCFWNCFIASWCWTGGTEGVVLDAVCSFALKNNARGLTAETFCLWRVPFACDTSAEVPIRETSIYLLLQSLQRAWVVDVGFFFIQFENRE